MKLNTIKHLSLKAAALCLGATITFGVSSCSDLLDQESDHATYPDKDHLTNPKDTVYSVLGIINKLQVIADRTILLGEARGDLVDVTSTTPADLRNVALFQIGDSNIYNSPRDYYAVINNCNYFLSKADTALKNNRNEYIFRKEFAAVKAYRAWTYLQLAINYGKVPFITEPILSNSDADKDYPRYDIQQICDYFISDLAPYVSIAHPGYGSIRNTNSDFFYFPIYVLLGDLNLWGGHYKEAALNYYNYIATVNGTNSTYAIGTYGTSWVRNSTKWLNASDHWSYTCFYSAEALTPGASELITMIPGDSIPSEGNYSQLRNTFNSNEQNNYSPSLVPSEALKQLSKSQTYCHLTNDNKVVYVPSTLDYERSGDLRLMATWNSSSATINGKRYDNIQNIYKYATRNIHLYRRAMVYLRMAEALNRAGYPRFAFEILKNGVNNASIEANVIPYYTADSSYIKQFNFPNNRYILRTSTERTDENTMGLHSRGAGWSEYNQYYTLPDDTTITDSLARIDYQILGVEDLIMDEEALEFAFEGYRYYDLLRVALRRGDASYLANRILARKGVNGGSAVNEDDLKKDDVLFMSWKGKIGPKWDKTHYFN
jgi:hypothetical protein